MSDYSNNSILALIAGVAIGAGLGILFAPDSGKKTREKLKSNIDEYSDELQTHLQELKSKIQATATDVGEHFTDRTDDIKSDVIEDTELTIAKLEARLAQLKDKLTQNSK
jgi:gas vesicle protein